MKPLFLKLRNIGPFVREEIDFTAVQDMFLVTGRTGSGKTTIFDAMTYALYGETAGYRSHKDVHLHSDYAPEDEDGSVEFTFLLNGVQYRIVRTVERSHTTRTGKKTKKLQTLEFYGRSGQGAQWEERRNHTKNTFHSFCSFSVWCAKPKKTIQKKPSNEGVSK